MGVDPVDSTRADLCSGQFDKTIVMTINPRCSCPNIICKLIFFKVFTMLSMVNNTVDR